VSNALEDRAHAGALPACANRFRSDTGERSDARVGQAGALGNGERLVVESVPAQPLLAGNDGAETPQEPRAMPLRRVNSSGRSPAAERLHQRLRAAIVGNVDEHRLVSTAGPVACSSERSALLKAASKERSMAITSRWTSSASPAACRPPGICRTAQRGIHDAVVGAARRRRGLAVTALGIWSSRVPPAIFAATRAIG